MMTSLLRHFLGPWKQFNQLQICNQTSRRYFAAEKSANHVLLIGRVGSDPVLRGSPNRPVVLFTLATSNVDSIEEDAEKSTHKTDRHRISVFRATLRKICGTGVKKGSRVLIQGKISYHPVTDETGSYQTTSIVADEVIILQPPPISNTSTG